jgi:hypothetical protein
MVSPLCLGIFDSILKAQRLKAADDIQFVERGSEHFFEGKGLMKILIFFVGF